MDSEEESDSEEVEEESEEESDSGVASLALASAFVAKSIFNHEDNGYVTDAENCDDDDYAPTYCFMAKGSKVSSRSSHSDTSEDESDDNLKPSYSKLAKIATKQQHAMEKIQNLLDKSDDLLNEEMDRSQSLTDDLKSLQSKYDELQSRHDALSADHEKLSYEYLQRKQDLEKLRASHDDLRTENDALLAQQISSAQDEFVPPCLKCIERDNANSSAECSNASEIAISSTISVVSNPSSEETTNIADENVRLKTLLETGMYKSLKGHQTLCDVLKKQILNRNPRKEGIGFERNINVDGTYWKPEQYPKTAWVAAKGPPVDPSTLSGYNCANPIIIDEST